MSIAMKSETPERARDRAGAHHAAGRAGAERGDGPLGELVRGHDAAVALHDQQVAAEIRPRAARARGAPGSAPASGRRRRPPASSRCARTRAPSASPRARARAAPRGTPRARSRARAARAPGSRTRTGSRRRSTRCPGGAAGAPPGARPPRRAASRAGRGSRAAPGRRSGGGGARSAPAAGTPGPRCSPCSRGGSRSRRGGPLVIKSPVTAPFISIIVLSAVVVPWTTRSVRARKRCDVEAVAGGELADAVHHAAALVVERGRHLEELDRAAGAARMKSVKVPPTSMPILYPMLGDRPFGSRPIFARLRLAARGLRPLALVAHVRPAAACVRAASWSPRRRPRACVLEAAA